MSKVRTSRVKIVEKTEESVTLLFLNINREIKVSNFLFEYYKKLGMYRLSKKKLN